MEKLQKARNVKLIWQDDEALCRAAAYYFVEICNKAISEKDRFSVALSGGNTPRLLYSLLASRPFSRNIDWKKVLFFWGDERFVPPDHPDSNYRMAKETLLDHVPVPRKHIFPIPTAGKPDKCAKEYEQTVRKILGANPHFDLTLLGMGEDGHTASLFPGTTILTEKKRLIKEVWVASKETWRISFTYKLINNSRKIHFLVSGAAKAPVIKKVFAGKSHKVPYPVQLISTRREANLWLLDEAAMGIV